MPMLPYMLWGALFAGIPIVIHLLNKSRFKVEPWGAMMFLQAASKVRSQRIKVQQWLLLLLRILFFIFLATALSRPIFNSGVGDIDQPITHVLVLDGSYSMQLGDGADNRFNHMITQAKELVQKMKDSDNMVLMWGSHKTKKLFRQPVYDKETLLKKLDSLEPGYGEFDIARALEQGFFALSESTLPRSRIYIMTDHQKNGWRLKNDRVWERLKNHK